MSKKQRAKALTKLAKSEGVITAETANAAISTVLSKLAKAAAEADRDGDGWRARSIREEATILKLSLAARAPSAGSRYGSMVSKLPITNKRQLPSDPMVGGI